MSFLKTPSPIPGKDTATYLAELIVLNKESVEVTSVGNLEPAENKWGRVGLTPEEAFHLSQLINFLKGILFCLGDPELEQDVLQLLAREVEHHSTGSKLYVPTGLEVQMFGR